MQKAGVTFQLQPGWGCVQHSVQTGLDFSQVIAFCSSVSSLDMMWGVKCFFLICCVLNASGMQLILLPKSQKINRRVWMLLNYTVCVRGGGGRDGSVP